MDQIETKGISDTVKTLALCLVVFALTSGCASIQSESGNPESDSDNLGKATVETSSEAADDSGSSGNSATEASLPRRPEADEYPVASFGEDELYKLLVAEVAGFRGHYKTALKEYVEVALSSRDPGVAARATSMATFMRENDIALNTARVWVEEDPDDINAHRIMVELLMSQGKMKSAIGHMEEVKRLGGFAEFGRFAWQAADLDVSTRLALLAAIDAMLLKYHDDMQLVYAKAVLMGQNGNADDVLLIAEQILAEDNNVDFIILKLNALRNLQREDEAIAFLHEMIDRTAENTEDNRRLRLTYARYLFEQGDLDKSEEQYKRVLEISPSDGEVLFALALIAMNQKDDATAKTYLNEMIRLNRRPGEAHFYLGNIAERNNDTRTAIRDYMKVGIGYQFLIAHARIATILLEQDRVQEARDHLSRMRAEAPSQYQQLLMVEVQLLSDNGFEDEVFDLLDTQLSQEPDNIDLLYVRAMTGERFNRLNILERDLRTILDIDPDNADALNALGYTLTDRTDRHEEALVLIEKALSIKPEEGAFIDSLGWVKYRLKQYEEAILHLRRALDLLPNDEVAAHLGEVLWVIGQQEEANEVWDKALESAPDSDILNRVIQQFRQR